MFFLSHSFSIPLGGGTSACGGQASSRLRRRLSIGLEDGPIFSSPLKIILSYKTKIYSIYLIYFWAGKFHQEGKSMKNIGKK